MNPNSQHAQRVMQGPHETVREYLLRLIRVTPGTTRQHLAEISGVAINCVCGRVRELLTPDRQGYVYIEEREDIRAGRTWRASFGYERWMIREGWQARV